jgi:hypothetical protein
MRGEPFTTTPQRGFYATRLVKGGIEVPAMVWHGQPVIAGERQDRRPRWCIAIDGRSDRFDKEQQCRVPLDALDHWPLQRRITASEYAFQRRRTKWAQLHQPDHPAANPYQRVDLNTLPPRF